MASEVVQRIGKLLWWGPDADAYRVLDAELTPLLAVVEAAKEWRAVRDLAGSQISQNLIDAVDALPKPAPTKAECECGGEGTVWKQLGGGCGLVKYRVLCPCIHAKFAIADERYAALKDAVEQLRKRADLYWVERGGAGSIWSPLP